MVARALEAWFLSRRKGELHASRNKIVYHSPGAGSIPAQIVPQHAYTHVSQDLGGLNNRDLIIVELARYAAHVLLATDTHNSVCAAQRTKRLHSAPNVIVSDRVSAVHPPSSNALSQIGQTDKTSVLSPCGTTNLYNAHSELKVEIVDRLSQQLRPYRAPVGATVAVAAG
ncbi:hypothetical protein HG531_000582 [Fusarium graminearum]|nr:hypothetical protein HG531_000582 [Fusarium graminearum]